jgi:Zn-dependent alcohol dehydrogenase
MLDVLAARRQIPAARRRPQRFLETGKATCPQTASVRRPDVKALVLAALGYLVGVSKPARLNFGSANFECDTPMYAELYVQGRMNLSALASRTIALRDVSDGYAALRGGSLNRVAVTSLE